jgi:lysophospholipase L1-like esterase
VSGKDRLSTPIPDLPEKVFMKTKYLLLKIMIVCLSFLAISSVATPRYFLALGDSVSSGYGLASHEESYSAIFYEFLYNEGYVDSYINMAVDGFTTTALLELLNNMDSKERRVFRNARIITVNIGGNNILAPFKNYLSNLGVVSGVDTIRSGAGGIVSGTLDIISGIRSGIETIIFDLEENKPLTPVVITGIGNVIAGTGNIITGTGEIISGSIDFFSIFLGSFSPELRNELENGVQVFSDEFKEIITLIKKRAPKATLIVNTVYNPIPQEVLRASLGISSATNMLLESMNSIIIQESKARGYLVTDISTHFSNRLDIMQFNINPTIGSLSLDIVHPNAHGHNLIAQMNKEIFKQR